MEIARSHALLKKVELLGMKETAKAEGIPLSNLYRLTKRAREGKSLFDQRRLNLGGSSAIDDTRLGWALAYMSAHQSVPISVVCRELNAVADREKWPETNYQASETRN